MRVTNRASTRNYLRYVNKGLSDQAKVQEKVASGNRFEKVSDDVSSGIKAMKAKSDQYKMEKQIGNIEDINNVLVAAEDSMQSIDDQLKTVHERFLRAMNDTNKNNRTIFATELKALKEEILQLANSQYNGQFLFSGSNNYGAPFSVDKETGHLVYNGVGVPADQIFRREDGTYYYETIQYDDETKQPIMEEVPEKDKDGNYVLLQETGNKKVPTEFTVHVAGNPPTTTDGGNTIQLEPKPNAAAPEYYEDQNNATTLYIRNPNNPTAFVKIDTASTEFSVTPGANADDPFVMQDTTAGVAGTNVIKIADNLYEADDGTLYLADPNTPANFYKVEATTNTSAQVDKIHQLQNAGAANQTIDGKPVTQTADGYEADDGTLYVENAWKTGYNEVNKVEQPVKTYRDVPLNEDIYLDVGLGIRMTGSTVDPQTAFNVSYAGPDILGFGVDEETGLSNNIYNLLNDMEKMLANADEYSTEQAQEFGRHLLDRLDAFRENVTDLGAKTQFLETMLDRLNKSRDNLEISIGNYTGTDYVEESRHQASASAVVNALYQLGSNIIPLSLMDFVK